jgi:hypothetical protein
MQKIPKSTNFKNGKKIPNPYNLKIHAKPVWCHAVLGGRGFAMVDGLGRGAERGISAGEEALLSSALESVQELNERCLGILQRLASGPLNDLPQFLVPLAPVLRKLDTTAIAGIARQPFLMVDFAFCNPQLLREMLTRPPHPLRFPAPRGGLPAADAASLARGALILAKAVCRHHPAHAGLLLGMDSSLREQIALLRLPDLECLADANPHHLRLRWDNRPEIWRTLLNVADASDSNALYQLRIYGMQLMAGEMKQKSRGIR